MNVDDIIANVEWHRSGKQGQRNGLAETLGEYRTTRAKDDPEVARVRAKMADVDAELAVFDDRIAELREEKARDEAVARISAESSPGAHTARAGVERAQVQDRATAPAAGARFVLRDRPDVPAAVGRGESFSTHPIVREYASARAANDATVKGVYGGSLAQMVRTVTDSGTSAVVPSDWSSNIIDLARNYSAVLKAGAQIVPMNANVVSIGRITGDPTSAFRAEGSTISASDPTLDNVVLTSRTMSCQVTATMEWLQDAINGEELIANEIAKSMALRLDYMALYGGIVTANSWAGINLPVGPGPRGVAATLLAVRAANVLGTGNANGLASTRYNELIDLDFTCEDLNEQPNALLWPSRLGRVYAKMIDSQNRPLNVPPPPRAR